MFVKEKDNGNWIIQKEKDEALCLEEQNLAISIVWHIPDMVLLGEQGCAGNFDMYQYFYNYHTDKKYMILIGRDGNAFLQGKPILLVALELNNDDREQLQAQEG